MKPGELSSQGSQFARTMRLCCCLALVQVGATTWQGPPVSLAVCPSAHIQPTVFANRAACLSAPLVTCCVSQLVKDSKLIAVLKASVTGEIMVGSGLLLLRG